MPWVKGQSGNPNGRPKVHGTLAEAIRKRFPPEELVRLAAAMIENRELKAGEFVQLLHWLSDRGYGKAPTVIELDAKVAQFDAKSMTSADKRARLEALLGIAVPDEDEAQTQPVQAN